MQTANGRMFISAKLLGRCKRDIQVCLARRDSLVLTVPKGDLARTPRAETPVNIGQPRPLVSRI